MTVAETPDWARPVLQYQTGARARLVVPAAQAKALRPGVDYFWKLTAPMPTAPSTACRRRVAFALTRPCRPWDRSPSANTARGLAACWSVRNWPAIPNPATVAWLLSRGFGPAVGLDGKPGGAVHVNGKDGMLVWSILQFPSYEYTVAVWFAHEHKEARLGQVFSAWSGGMDDPLRLCIDRSKLFARVEAGNGYSTSGIAVEPKRWYHVVAVKSGRV